MNHGEVSPMDEEMSKALPHVARVMVIPLVLMRLVRRGSDTIPFRLRVALDHLLSEFRPDLEAVASLLDASAGVGDDMREVTDDAYDLVTRILQSPLFPESEN